MKFSCHLWRTALSGCFQGKRVNLKTDASRKQSTPNFPKNKHFLPPPPWYTHVRAYQWVRNLRFSENLRCFVFLKHPFWDSPFRLIIAGLSPNYSDCFTRGGIWFQIFCRNFAMSRELLSRCLRSCGFSCKMKCTFFMGKKYRQKN